MDIEEIKKEAEKELKEEQRRELIDYYKEKFRNKRNLWDKIFPYKIVFINKRKED